MRRPMVDLLLGLTSRLVPRSQREEWLEEWRSEVWHYREGREGSARPEPGLVVRCLVGAPLHAVSLRLQSLDPAGLPYDLRAALRTTWRHPAFSAMAVVTLGVGIGGNVAIFSTIDSVLLTPLPIENEERLVWVWGREFQGRNVASVSPPDYRDYRALAGPVFEEFAAYANYVPQLTFLGDERPDRVRAALVTENLLRALGAEPVLGRTFTSDEVASDRAESVMLSHAFWTRAFGADPSILGQSLQLGGATLTVVGVLPPTLDFPAGRDVWLPLTMGDSDSRAAHSLRPIGLLANGTALEEAQSALDVVSTRLAAAYPETNDGWFAQIEPLSTVLVGSARPTLMLLLGATGLVLLIACANVANLFLARGAHREGELAIRVAVGASRGRVARQLLAESAVLALLAGAVGFGIGNGAVSLLRTFDAGNLPRMDELTVDATALAFTVLLSLGVGLLFGSVPALASTRRDAARGLTMAGRSGLPASARRFRGGLVIGEVAVSMVLLVCAGLLLQSLERVQRVNPGFESSNRLRTALHFETTAGDDEVVQRTGAILD